MHTYNSPSKTAYITKAHVCMHASTHTHTSKQASKHMHTYNSPSKTAYIAKARNAKAMADALAYSKESSVPESESESGGRNVEIDVIPATVVIAEDMVKVVNWAYRGKQGKQVCLCVCVCV